MRDVQSERRTIDRIVAGQTVCSLFQDTVSRNADGEALKWKTGDTWATLSWGAYADHVRRFTAGLIALGLEAGQFVNILAANRPEYYVSDLAILHAGAIPVSLYNSLAPDQIAYIVNHCEAVFIIVENAAYYQRVAPLRDRLPRVRNVILIDDAD